MSGLIWGRSETAQCPSAMRVHVFRCTRTNGAEPPKGGERERVWQRDIKRGRERELAQETERARERKIERECGKGLLLPMTEKSSGLAFRLECCSWDKVGHKRLCLYFILFFSSFPPSCAPNRWPNPFFSCARCPPAWSRCCCAPADDERRLAVRVRRRLRTRLRSLRQR